MNTYITLSCILALAALGHSSALYGYGSYGLAPTVIHAPLLAPAAVSSQNLWKGAPIPVIKPILAPLYSAPIYKTIVSAPVISTIPSWSPYGPIGLKNVIWTSPYGWGKWAH